MSTIDTAELTRKIQGARLVARHVRPYFAQALFSMKLVMAEDCPTMGVSRNWVCYWSPEFADKHTVRELAGVLIHELLHLLSRHHSRAKLLIGQDNSKKWNVAADFEINDSIGKDVELPKGGCYPMQLGLPDGKLAEWYYDQITEQIEPQMGGSSADGVPRPWEKGEKNKAGESQGEKTAALSEAEATIRQVAEAVKRHAQNNGRGSVPAGIDRWADVQLSPAKVRWEKELSAQIRRAAQQVSGMTDFTRGRPNRRQAAYGRVVRASMFRPVPEVAVVVDTSGSIGEKQVEMFMAEINGILKAVQAKVRVLGCDTVVYGNKKVSSVNQAADAIKGGGGTDLRVGISECEKHRADIIVVLTDGLTPWPDEAPRGKLVVVLTQTNGDVPTYAKAILMEE